MKPTITLQTLALAGFATWAGIFQAHAATIENSKVSFQTVEVDASLVDFTLDAEGNVMGCGFRLDSTSFRPIQWVGTLFQDSKLLQLPSFGTYTDKWVSMTGNHPLAISENGTTIVGSATLAGPAGSASTAYRYENGHLEDLGSLGAYPSRGTPYGKISYRNSCAYGVSSDGSVIVGRSTARDSEMKAFVWTPSDKMRAIPVLGIKKIRIGRNTIVENRNIALAVSDHGTVVVGESSSLRGSGEAFRYHRLSGNLEGLGFLADLGSMMSFSSASGVSPNGSLVVGKSRNAQFKEEGFIWKDGKMTSLGANTIPKVVSDNGTVLGVLTSNKVFFAPKVFVWNAASGLKVLEDLLQQDLALDVTGWKLIEAVSISADGTEIRGFTMNPQGKKEAFVLNFL